MPELIKFNAAKKALAVAKSVDEVKSIRNAATATRLYAQQAKDKTLIQDASEIRLRAERRLGEMMQESLKAKGGGDVRRKHRGLKLPGDPITLSEVGIDKYLAKRARAAAAPTDRQFEKKVVEIREAAASAVETVMRVVSKTEARKERESVLALKLKDLPKKEYGVLYADPPWRFETYSKKGSDRAAENHYPTMTDDEIIALGSRLPFAHECCLFLWATAPKLLSALAVMKAWGFEYKSFLAWDKKIAGTGHIVRSQVELLLIGTRGGIVPPMGMPGLISVKRTVHSAKPDRIADLIEAQYPNLPKLEMFARRPREGWDVWGNEV